MIFAIPPIENLLSSKNWSESRFLAFGYDSKVSGILVLQLGSALIKIPVHGGKFKILSSHAAKNEDPVVDSAVREWEFKTHVT